MELYLMLMTVIQINSNSWLYPGTKRHWHAQFNRTQSPGNTELVCVLAEFLCSSTINTFHYHICHQRVIIPNKMRLLCVFKSYLDQHLLIYLKSNHDVTLALDTSSNCSSLNTWSCLISLNILHSFVNHCLDVIR